MTDERFKFRISEAVNSFSRPLTEAVGRFARLPAIIDLMVQRASVNELPADDPIRIIWDRVNLDDLPATAALALLPNMPKPPRRRGRPRGTGPVAENADRIAKEIERLAADDPGKTTGQLILEAHQALGLEFHGNDLKHRVDYVRRLIDPAAAE